MTANVGPSIAPSVQNDAVVHALDIERQKFIVLKPPLVFIESYALLHLFQ